MNWQLTLTKGLVVGALAAIGVWIGDAKGLEVAGNVPPWAAGIAVLILEAVRDTVKSRFGSFTPAK